MENDTMFYVLGATLIAAAAALAGLGLRQKDFPSPGVFRGLMVAFAALVVATSVFAVRSASDEAHEREENEAAEMEEEAAGEAAGVAEADQPGPPGALADEPSGQGDTLKLGSPADGSLSFEPAMLQAKPGTITLAYDNPSPVPHNIALESPQGEELAQSETGANGEFAITAEVEAGEYVFFCSVPGHRESGMEGKLAVQ